MATLQIHLRDLGQPLVDAWRREFTDVPSVTISCGDIFSMKPGPIAPSDPIEVKADAIVSPANSFGFMDGGIDALYTYQFGSELQQRLQAVIATEHGGELPVGAAVIVPTLHPDIPWCISAPTMRVPRDVSDTLNAYLAFARRCGRCSITTPAGCRRSGASCRRGSLPRWAGCQWRGVRGRCGWRGTACSVRRRLRIARSAPLPTRSSSCGRRSPVNGSRTAEIIGDARAVMIRG